MDKKRTEREFDRAELYLQIAEGLLNAWLTTIDVALSSKKGISRDITVQNCGGCTQQKLVFKIKRKARMEETQEQLTERLAAIREKFDGRLTRRIAMTREAINFLEESKGHMCGGCAERRLQLLKKKLEELEQRKSAL